MSGFYEDSDKITFDRAEVLVGKYIRQYGDMVNRVTCKDVAEKYDVEDTHHNLIRINNALSDELEVARESGSKATQYALDSHGTGDSSSER